MILYLNVLIFFLPTEICSEGLDAFRFFKIMPNKRRTISSWVREVRLHVRRGKGTALNPFRDKNCDKHRRRKVEKSCVTLLSV